MTKYLFVHLLNDYSGSPQVLKEAIDSINSENSLLFTSQHKGFLSSVKCKKINVPYQRYNKKYLTLFSYLISQIYLFFVLSFVIIFLRFFKRQKTTVVVNTILPFGAVISSRLFANRTISYIHELYVSPVLLSNFLKWVVYIFSNERLYVSNYLKNEYLDSKGIVIHNGLRSDFPLVIFSEDDLKSKFKKRSCVFVGSLKTYKGVDILCALAALNPDVKFVAAINSSYEDLVEYINKNRVLNNLTFLSRPSNLYELYSNATLLLNLSRPDQWIETFGLTILEGFSYYCPAIVPPVGGQMDFCNDSNSLSIDSRNLDNMNDAIKSYLNNYEYWLSSSYKAKDTANIYSNENFRNKIREFLG